MQEGDRLWLATPDPTAAHVPIGGRARTAMATTSPSSRSATACSCRRRVARRLQAKGVAALGGRPALDRAAADGRHLREANAHRQRAGGRRDSQSGGVAEGVLAALIDAGFTGPWLRRVTSKDSFIPLGDAAKLVLLSEDEIEAAIERLLAPHAHDTDGQ
jgi:2-oxoisovalerate dehydrogenase E1 component